MYPKISNVATFHTHIHKVTTQQRRRLGAGKVASYQETAACI